MSVAHVNRVRTLYKTILRMHRALPPEMAELGNNYAKGELEDTAWLMAKIELKEFFLSQMNFGDTRILRLMTNKRRYLCSSGR